MTSSTLLPHDESCLITLATPVGRSAIATVLVSGTDATAQVSARFRAASGLRLEHVPVNQIVFGKWQSNEGPAEDLVVCRRNGQLVEVHCHGGTAAFAAIMSSLIASGCRQIDWQAWLRSTGDDPVSIEARVALSRARTTRTAELLLNQLNGALRQAIGKAIDHLNLNQPAIALDIIARLMLLADVGLHLAYPWQVVLAGLPNVGKSSLINAMLGYERAIVYDQPGTTRDVVAAHAAIDGWPLELADTAGLRAAEGPIEAQGINLARDRASRADLLLMVFDASLPWSEKDTELLEQHPDSLIVHNKWDLMSNDANRPNGIHTSATRGDGIRRLLDAIVSRLVRTVPDAGEAVPFTDRQIILLSRAADSLGVDDRNTAIKLLQEI